MEIQQLRYFVAICRTLSFSKAAEVCFISSQGVSMAIKRLEEYLSCRLFERTSKGIVLTEHARYLLPIAEQIVELMNTCEAYFISGTGADQHLSIMLTRGILQEFAEAPVMEFMRRYPDIYLELRQGYDTDCEDAIDSQKVELALTAGPVDPKKYEAEYLHSARYGIVVHKDEKLALRNTVNIRDLDGLPLTVMQERQKTMTVLRTAAKEAGVELNIQARVDNALLTYQYADLRWVAGISTWTLESHFTSLNLRFIPFDDPVLSWTVYLIKQRGRELSPAAQLLEQLVKQHRDNRLMDMQSSTS